MINVLALKENHTIYQILREISGDIDFDLNIIGLDEQINGMNQHNFYKNQSLYEKPFLLYIEEFLAFQNPDILSHPNFKGLVTHITDTYNNLYKTYNTKVYHLPLSSHNKDSQRILNKIDSIISNRPVKFIAWGSWSDYEDNNFYNRGGEKIDELMSQLLDRGLNVNLTFKTINHLNSKQKYPNNINLIPSYLSNDEMDNIFYDCDLFLLPSKQVHSASLTYAMSFGMPCIVSDGWGINEFCNEVNSINIGDLEKIVHVCENRQDLKLMQENTMSYYSTNHSRNAHIINFKNLIETIKN
jgi:glycosyltransferase involved in cell wall biosynthesis